MTKYCENCGEKIRRIPRANINQNFCSSLCRKNSQEHLNSKLNEVISDIKRLHNNDVLKKMIRRVK